MQQKAEYDTHTNTHRKHPLLGYYLNVVSYITGQKTFLKHYVHGLKTAISKKTILSASFPLRKRKFLCCNSIIINNHFHSYTWESVAKEGLQEQTTSASPTVHHCCTICPAGVKRRTLNAERRTPNALFACGLHVVSLVFASG